MGIITNAAGSAGGTIGGSIGSNVIGAVGAAAEQAALEQIRLLKNTLTGGAGLATDGSSSQPPPATLKYYAKLKALGLLYVGLESVIKVRADKKTDKYYKETVPKHAKASQQQPEPTPPGGSEYIPTRLLFDSTKIKDPEKVTSEYPFANKNEKVANPDPNEILRAGPGESPYDKGTYTPTELSQKVEKFYLDNNDNAGAKLSTPSGQEITMPTTMPVPGEEVAGHSGLIGESFANATEFTVTNGNGQTQKLVKSWILPNGKPNTATHGTLEQTYLDKVSNMLEGRNKTTVGSYRFFIEKLHGKSVDGSWNKKNPIKPGAEREDMPNRMVFPAYIVNFNDAYDVTWNPYDFHGRGESVYIYKGTARSLTLEFYMMSDFSSELLLNAIKEAEEIQESKGAGSSLDGVREKLAKTTIATPNQSSKNVTDNERLEQMASKTIMGDWGNGTGGITTYVKGDKTGFIEGQYSGTPEMLWHRMTFLAQCCYGWYRNDGKLKEQPFIRVRIGDFFDCIAKINSMQHSTDEFDMDLNPSTTVGALPMGIKVSMNMTIVHEDEPSSTYNKFYHRLDRDDNGEDHTPIGSKETSSTMDSVLDVNVAKSPASFNSTVSNAGQDKMKFPKESKIGLQEALKFNKSLGALDKSKTNLKDFAKREKLKEVFQNAKNLLSLKSKTDSEKVTNSQPDNPNALTEINTLEPKKKKLFG